MSELTGTPVRTEMTAGNRRITSKHSDHRTVLVQAADGKLLNPCHPARARELLRKKRAVRVSRHPYTIRLLLQNQAETMILLYAEEELA